MPTSYDPFGVYGSQGTKTTTVPTNYTGGTAGKTAKANAGRVYDPFNISSVQAVPNPNVAPKAPVKAAPKPSASLFSKVVGGVKSVGNAAISGERTAATGIARVLPGGTADIQAEQQGVQQAAKDLAFVKQQQAAGKVPKAQATKLIQAIANNASQSDTAVGSTVKALPSSGQIAAGFGSTAADIATGGTLPEIKGGLIGARVAKTATTAAHGLAYGASGALNAASTGGTKKQIEENALAGTALPGATHLLGKVISKGATAVGDKIAASDGKVANTVKTAQSVVGSKAPAKSLIKSQRVQSLIDAGQKQQEAEAPLLQMKAAINQDHVSQGLIKPEIKQTPISQINIPADHNVKLDSGKVNQYAQQIKDGEPIEPIVTHNLNGQTTLVDGEHKLAAAQKLGITEVPTVEKVPGATPLAAESTGTVTKPSASVESTTKPAAAVAASAEPKASMEQPSTTKETTSVSSPDNSAKVDTAPIKSQIQAIKNDDKSYDANGNVTPEAAKQITTLNKQLNAAGERVPKAEKPVTVTPVESKSSVLATPDLKTTKLSQGVEANAVKKGLSDGFADKPEYAKVNRAQQVKAATELVKNDPDRAVRIAMGQEKPPEGLLPESAFIAVESAATKAKDGKLLRQLGTQSHLTSEASGMGQRISMLAERDTNSPAARIQQVAKARADVLEKKSGTTVAKATSNEIRQIRAATPKANINRETFSSFVESLRC